MSSRSRQPFAWYRRYVKTILSPMPLCAPAFFSPPKSSPMGTRKNYPGWVPYQGFGTPSFSRTSYHGNLPATLEGAGTGEPQQRLRVDASFHRLRSPFLERHGGVLAGRSASAMDEKPHGSRQSAGHPGASLGQESGRTWGSAPGHDTIRHGDDAGRGSRHVAPLRRWLR